MLLINILRSKDIFTSTKLKVEMAPGDEQVEVSWE